MKLNYLLLLIFLFIASSCEKELLPTDRFYPFTSPVKLITNDGSTIEFSGNFLSLGEEEILSHGFIWKVIDDRFDKIFIDTFFVQESPSLNEFSFKTDSHFATDFRYQINVFAKTRNNIVLGSPYIFTSKGTQKNPWKLNTYQTSISAVDPSEVSFRLHSFQDDVYALFYNSGFFKLNGDSFEQKEDYPYVSLSPLSSNKVVNFSLGDRNYFWNTQKTKFYFYKKSDDTWDSVSTGTLPTGTLDYISQGFSFNDRMYVMDKNTFLKSSTTIVSSPFDSWEELNPIPSSPTIISLNPIESISSVIAVTEDNILWKYDLMQEGSWEEVSTLPFSIGSTIVNFNFNNKIILGPSFSSNSNAQEWWCFDMETNSWKQIAPFPLTINEDLKIKNGKSSSQGFFGVDLTYTDSLELKTAIWLIEGSKL